MFVASFPTGPLQVNCTILGCPTTHQALVVDPGGDLDRILAVLDAQQLKLHTTLLTHAHFDHLLAVPGLKQARGGELRMHRGDQELYERLPMQGAAFGFEVPAPPAIDRYLEDGELVRWGDCEAQVLHTPGHSPGGICLYVPAAKLVLTGDTLFAQGIGRTDLWGGSYPTLIASIKERLFTLPPDTRAIPGHGEETTLGTEQAHNPFLA